MGDRPELKSRDSREVGRIACVERQRMCDRARSDECVVRARRGLTPRCAQYGGDGAKCPRAITIERKNIKVRLGLLQVLLTGTALGIVARYMRTYGELGERYRADDRFIWKLGWVGYLAEENHR